MPYFCQYLAISIKESQRQRVAVFFSSTWRDVRGRASRCVCIVTVRMPHVSLPSPERSLRNATFASCLGAQAGTVRSPSSGIHEVRRRRHYHRRRPYHRRRLCMSRGLSIVLSAKTNIVVPQQGSQSILPSFVAHCCSAKTSKHMCFMWRVRGV